MSRRLTQPEEIDQILKEMAEEESRPPPSAAGKIAGHWDGPYVPPYRAEYIKSHGLPDQGKSRQR